MEQSANAERPSLGSENRNCGGTEADGGMHRRYAYAVFAGSPKTALAPRARVSDSRELRPFTQSLKRCCETPQAGGDRNH
jgi:hypothetical protein